jgi:Domain of unknown function (DUF4157)
MSGETQGKIRASPPALAVEAEPAAQRSVRGPVNGSRGWSPRPPNGGGGRSAAGHAFGQMRLYPGASQRIEASLQVAKPDDPCEVEAERAADAVAAGAPVVIGRCAASPLSRAQVRARAMPGHAPGAPPALSAQIDSARVEGAPLPAEQRGFYEQRFGHDFRAVRLHTGPASAAAAASVRAQAFTHGQDIYFGAGYHRPDTVAGQRLIAHELAHTLQQRPNVIARQPLDGVATMEAPPPDAAGSVAPSMETDEDEGQSPGATADEIDGLLTSDPSDTSGRARRRINQMRPSARHQAATSLIAKDTGSLARQEGVARVIGATAAAPTQGTSTAEGATPGAVRGDGRRKERPGTPDARAVQSAAASAPPPSPTVVRPAASVPEQGAAAPQTLRGAETVARSVPSIVPRTPPSVTRSSPPVRAPGPPSPASTEPAPERGGAERTEVEARGEASTPAESGAAPSGRAAGPRGAPGGGVPGGGGASAAMSVADDERPLRLADLFEQAPAQPGANGRTTREAAGRAAGAPAAADGVSAMSKPAASEVQGARSDEAAAEMDGLAGQLEAALAAMQQNLQTQATTISGRVRQQAAGGRAGIRAEVNQAVQKIQDGQTSFLSELSGTVATNHGLIDAFLAMRKLEATATGLTSQQNIRGIFSGHRDTVSRTVNHNIELAEKLRTDKAAEVQRRNRADIRSAYIKGGEKMRTYPGTNRGSYIGGAAFDVAEGVGKKMREQEPEIIGAITEVTAPLPQYFREQGANALDGFDVNLPQILASVDSGVVQAHGDQDQRAREAHARLNVVADQTRVDIDLLAGEAIAQAAAFGPQLEERLDQELRRTLHAVAAAPRDVMRRITPPIEEAITLLRTSRDPDVDAANEMTSGLLGFLDESTATTTDTMERAAETSGERFQGMRTGARQAMKAQVERSNKVYQDARTGLATSMGTMLSNFDSGFAGAVTLLRETLNGTEQSIRDQLGPVVTQLDGSFGETLRDSEGKIDGRINEGLGKNTEALNDLDGKMAEAASDAAYEWDHPVLSSIEAGLSFLAGLIAGILTVLAMVAVLLLVGWIIATVLGVSMLAAGLIMLAGMAAFSIGFSFGARLAAGQGIGEAFTGAVGDFARAAPGMLYDMTGIPKLRRAFSDERMTPYERGKLIGEGGTELLLAIFMVRGAAKGIATGFKNLRFRPVEITTELGAPRPVVDTVAARPSPATGTPRPTQPPVSTPTAPKAVAPRPTARMPEPTTTQPVAETVTPRPGSAPGTPRPTPQTVSTAPAPETVVPRPTARMPEPAPPRPSPLPENIRPIESAEPGFAGRQPQLRSQRPMTTADEFAARMRARQARPAGEGTSGPEAQPQVQREPVAQAAGAEGYGPQQIEPPGQPRLGVIEGGAGRANAPGGRSPLDVRASGEPPGGGAGRGRPAGAGEGPRPGRGGAGGGEGPRPARAGAGAGERSGPTRSSGEPTRPARGETSPETPETQPLEGQPAQQSAPREGAAAERPASEPVTGAPERPPAPSRVGPRSRVTHEKFGDGTVVRVSEGKATVEFDQGGQRTIVTERLTPTERPPPAGSAAERAAVREPTAARGRGAGERRPTRAERATQGRRDAESAAIQREAQGVERPTMRDPTLDELSRQGESEVVPEAPGTGEPVGAQVRRGPGGRQVVSEDHAVAEAAGSAFERPFVREFATAQPSTAETFGSSLRNWPRLRARFPRIARLFGGGSRPDAVSVDAVNRRITLFDPTSRPNPTHWEGSLEYMQRLLDDPLIREAYNGWEVTVRERYWEAGFENFSPSRTARIGGPSGGGAAQP